MILTINEIMKLKEFNNSYFLTGNGNISRKVTSITIMDIANIDEWIKPYELLIAGNFFETVIDAEFIKRLSEKKCSGIITKNKFIKYISSEILTLSEMINFPIIIVSDEYSWSELITPITQQIIKLQQKIIIESDQFQSAIINSVLKNHSFDNMCTSISKAIGHSLAIINTYDEIIDASSDFDWHNELKDFEINVNSKFTIGYDLQGDPINGYIQLGLHNSSSSFQFAIYPIQDSTIHIGYIVIKIDKNLNIIENSLMLKIQSFAQILVLKNMIYKDLYQANLYYRELILDEILNLTELTSTQKIRFELSIGHPIENNYYICIFQLLDNQQKQLWSMAEKHNIIDFLKKYYYDYSKILVFIKEEQLIIFIGESIRNSVKSIGNLLSLFQYYFSSNDIYAGISQLRRLEQAALGLKEAKHALNFILKNNSSKKYQFYKDLGFLRLLTDKKGDIENIYFEELLNSFIKPIIDYDSKYNTQLLNTIQIYFKNNFSNKETSESLFIHKNTLRARIQRIEEVLSINFTDNDDTLNLQIALKIYETMK
ncbi:PucR family transcriptional regulator [Bacillus tuaregi]|uniref:PucR family transcriptional regulator n=1 Tax=Bacillus tuaregi TaxID=1816695 RepID=UPI0008F849FE|nr:PucR family transcriptional regulator [Bacillus tuaregi]